MIYIPLVYFLLVIVPIIGLVVMVLFFMYIVARDRWKTEGSQKEKRKAFALMMAIMIISASTLVFSLLLYRDIF